MSRRRATRAASPPRSRSSLKTGTNAPDSAASATSARTRFGIWIATVKALMRPVTPKKYALTISHEPENARDRGGQREDGRRSREAAAVAALIGRCGAAVSSGVFIGRVAGRILPVGCCYHRATRCGPSLRMANIKQQKKRVRIQERQRARTSATGRRSRRSRSASRRRSRRVTPTVSPPCTASS